MEPFLCFGFQKDHFPKSPFWQAPLGWRERLQRRACTSSQAPWERETWPHPCPATHWPRGVSQASNLFGHPFSSSSMRRQNWVSMSKSIFPETLSLKMLLKKMFCGLEVLKILCVSPASLTVISNRFLVYYLNALCPKLLCSRVPGMIWAPLASQVSAMVPKVTPAGPTRSLLCWWSCNVVSSQLPVANPQLMKITNEFVICS